MRVPAATAGVFNAVLDTTSSLRLPFSIKKAPLGTAAEVAKKPNFIQFYEISRLTWRHLKRRLEAASQGPAFSGIAGSDQEEVE
jgi:hypothetical protein